MHDTDKDRKHREQVAMRLSPEGRKYFRLIEFDSNEELITEIRKHPFGLFLILLTGGLITLALLAITVSISFADFDTALSTNNLNSLRPAMIILGLLLMIASVVITFISAFLYKGNVIFVTSEKIAQTLYISLFHRKISQLSIGDVQDVTVTQKGIFAHFFNYGTLVIETAGEQQNYTFSYVPEPHETSKLIVGSHERNMIKHGN